MSMLRTICLVLLFAACSIARAGNPVPPISGVLEVSIGGGHSCLLTALGEVRCWGLNSSEGRLGIGVAGDPVSLSEPQPIQATAEFIQVAAGNAHTCALRADGSVACWGKNSEGQLGDSTVDSFSPTPLDVPGLTDVVELASGDNHSCALIEGGTVRCWGRGDLGQLGNGTVNRAAPLDVIDLSGVVQVAAGGHFNCARRVGGAVSCWGHNGVGQLGRVSSGVNDFDVTPAEVAALGGPASDLALGVSHTCALVAGRVRCWGQGTQLGDGGETSRHTPGDVLDITGGAPLPLEAVELGAGDSHSCAVRPSGAVMCWGSGFRGQLGNGDNSDALNPVAVQGLDGSSLAASAVQIDGGFGHTCIRTGTGEARCWGANFFRQLGDGTLDNSNVPVVVRAPQELMSLVASADSLASGESLTLTATVNLQPFSLDDLPGARVTFYDGRTPIAGCVDLPLAGDPPSVPCTTSALAEGVHEVSALYSGGAFSSPTLAGPLRITVNGAVPTLSVHTFDFYSGAPVIGDPLLSIPEDTRPFDLWLNLPAPITTHLLRVADMPFAFDQLQFEVAHDNPALFEAGSFGFLDGEFSGEPYKAVTIAPRPNANGSATLTYSVLGPANQVLATESQQLTVSAVNDPPATVLSLEQDSAALLTLLGLPDGAAAGSTHDFKAKFQLYGTPADEAAQSLLPLLTQRAGSTASPVTGTPQFLGLGSPEAEQLVVDYRATASGEDGWVRYDVRLQDDGGGFCLDSGQGADGATLQLAGFFDLLTRLFRYDDPPQGPSLLDKAIALTKPGALRLLTPEQVHTSVLANACSRTSRMYVVRGDWAHVEAAAEWRSRLSAQLSEVLGQPIDLGKSTQIAGETYLFSFRNAGNLPLTGLRVRIAQPPGLSAIAWTCERDGAVACATPSGSGSVDLLFDLDVDEAVFLGVEASFDGSQSFVTLRGEAVYPPGVRAIRDYTQAVQVVLPTSADGLIQNGFER